MDLYDAVEAGDVKAVRAALKKGAKPSISELELAITRPLEVLRMLVEHAKGADLAKKKDGSLLLQTVAFEIRSAYPNPARLRRSKDPSAPEPAVIVDLRAKAKLLRGGGAPLDFGAAAMLGYTDVVKAMLAKDPKLATKKVHDQSITDLAAWAGAWETSRLLKDAPAGKAFDWNKLSTALHSWALKSLNAFAKRQRAPNDRFRRVAFDVDDADVLIAADLGARKSKRPGDFSHGEIASFEDHALGESIRGQLERPDAAKQQKFFAALVQAANLLENDASLKLARSDDFMVLVFDHDDDEKAALARRRPKAGNAKNRQP